MQPEKIESLIANLPDADGARRFHAQFSEKFPSEAKKLQKNQGLLSDVLTVAAYSPLLAATILQNPQYIGWLDRQRASAKVRGKEELLESLARFALVNSGVETNVLLARFRRRELLRIYLRDIRALATVAEITEEISNLADAVLEYALRIARQEMDNRYGAPLEIDGKNRAKTAEFCIVALGKLGSRELNYASDIDLLFLFSNDGTTSGQGARGAATNREYFTKLAESIVKTVGAGAGEGAAYRVDLRLRPHGRVGALAISQTEAINYYKNSAQAWERQVLIRSRSCAGQGEIFRNFFETVKSNVFSPDETVENALRNVRLSKEKINSEKTSDKGFNVKLGRGGIREIEFVAQALQLAHGGRDEWLRAPHTLISLSRLADRKLLAETDLTELYDAYAFLRGLEHRQQMENGLQIYIVPEAAKKRLLIARQMNFDDLQSFNDALEKHTENVSRIFMRIFGEKQNAKILGSAVESAPIENNSSLENNLPISADAARETDLPPQILAVLRKSDAAFDLSNAQLNTLKVLSKISPHFAETTLNNSALIKNLPNVEKNFARRDYKTIFQTEIENAISFADKLAVLRKTWTEFLLEIVVFDIFEKISRADIKGAQTALAEAAIAAAASIAKSELERKFSQTFADFRFAVLGLGKLGGGGMDYNSDLDLILIFDDEHDLGFENATRGEFYSRAAEVFVTALSSLTRDGYLYRVDLRLRPDGKNGATTIGKTAFLQYLENRAAVWEWLAYVKLRAVGGDFGLGETVETDAREIIHRRAAETDVSLLAEETSRVRSRLEREKTAARKTNEIDIKFAAGGLLDVYFALRFLQLSRDVPDAGTNRSTLFTLEKLRAADVLSHEDFQDLTAGYKFLNELDHNLRLAVGRSTRVPVANRALMEIIARRMKIESVQKLLEDLTLQRLNVRRAFENIVAPVV